MFNKISSSVVKHFFSKADVSFNGSNPWDVRVNNEQLFKRIILHGSLGFGEAYMEKWWDCDAIDELVCRLLEKGIDKKTFSLKNDLWKYLHSRFFNLQKRKKAFNIGEKHYDKGNELFKNMLDSRMIYSCAYWKNANNLEEAQEAKLELICKKLGLSSGMKILDIGCGWGGFLKYACEHYNIEGTGITVSKEQAELAKERCKGLPIKILLTDYRDLKKEKFDYIVSIGMFEHVGYKNYRRFMKKISSLLEDSGLFLLHTIGTDVSVRSTDAWINKYIFPNGMLPSPVQLTKSIEKIFKIEDFHNFGNDYDKTLMCWYENFENYWEKKKQLSNGEVDETFYRMWRYYLLSCAGAFRARHISVWQVVLSKRGVKGGYTSIR